MGQPKKESMQELAVYWTQAQPAVAAFVSSMIPNFQDANDVLGLVAVALVKKFDDYDRNKPFVAWAIGMARYEVLNWRRKKANEKYILDEQAMAHVADAYKEDAGNLDEIKNALGHCIKQLTGRWRKMLEMRYVREFKPSRIGQQFGMTPNTVFVTLHRIRVTLRECVDRRIASQETGR